MHLTAGALVDLAEGQRPQSAEAHLQSCERCRRRLADLRAAMVAARAAEVPEPSPLFWDHLSSRVRQAVAAQPLPRRPFLDPAWLTGLTLWRAPTTWAAAVVSILLIALVVGHGPAVRPAPPGASGEISDAAVDLAALPAFGSPDDATLAFVGDLASQMDPDGAADAGLVNHPGGLDEVVATMTAGERAELQRILKDELAKS